MRITTGPVLLTIHTIKKKMDVIQLSVKIFPEFVILCGSWITNVLLYYYLLVTEKCLGVIRVPFSHIWKTRAVDMVMQFIRLGGSPTSLGDLSLV